MLFVSVFVSMLGMMILIISLLDRPHFYVLKLSSKSCLDSGYRPTVDFYLLKFELAILGAGEPFGHSPAPPPLSSPLTYKLAGPGGVRAGGEGDITQVGWGWFSVNRQWKFKSSNLFLGTINCEFMKSHAGKS